ncbi:Triacylglycerol lipase, partial [Trichostrongylus colubriformis]
MFTALVCVVLLSSALSALPVLAKPAQFSDEFARTKVVPLCAATELDDPQICLSRTFTNATVLHSVTRLCNKISNDTCRGYTAINHADKAIMLAFRGTVGDHQLVLESKETLFNDKIQWIAGGAVSRYFYNAFFALWNGGIKDDFLALANKYKDHELWIVGHSLGGSIASLAASYIEKVKLFDGNRIKLVTFGQPRTGDDEFASVHDLQIPYSFRVTHAHDVIPHSPPKGYHSYKHHKAE